MKLEFSRHIFEKNTQMSHIMKICPVGAKLFNPYKWTDMTKPIVSFCNFPNMPIKRSDLLLNKVLCHAHLFQTLVFFLVCVTRVIQWCQQLLRSYCVGGRHMKCKYVSLGGWYGIGGVIQRNTKLVGNLSQHHFTHHKSQIDWPGIEPGFPQWQTNNIPPEPLHCLFAFQNTDCTAII